MDFLEIANIRQSCRAFDRARPVEEDALRACLEAARLAPSACNAQPYRIFVARGPAAERVGEATRSMGMNKFTKDAPVFLVFTEDSYNATAAVGAKVKRQDYRSVDIGIAVAYLTAQAASLGLGSCILGWFEEDKLQKILGISNRVRLIVALGYPREGDPLREKKRKSLDDLTQWL